MRLSLGTKWEKHMNILSCRLRHRRSQWDEMPTKTHFLFHAQHLVRVWFSHILCLEYPSRDNRPINTSRDRATTLRKHISTSSPQKSKTFTTPYSLYRRVFVPRNPKLCTWPNDPTFCGTSEPYWLFVVFEIRKCARKCTFFASRVCFLCALFLDYTP